MFIVTAVETVGDISGVMEGGLGREATDKELSGGVICDGLGSSLAGIFGGSGIVPAAMVAIILNIVLPKEKVE